MVPSAFPSDICTAVCLNWLDSSARSSILPLCEVEDGTTYSAGERSVPVYRSVSLKNTISTGFNGTVNAGDSYLVNGDLILPKNCSIFSVHVDAVNENLHATVTHIQFGNDAHYHEILFASNNQSEPMWVLINGPAYPHNIRCSKLHTTCD